MNKNITINKNNHDFPAYLSYPENPGKTPAIILIHEIWGLTDHIKDVANRLTKEGYAVLAPDLLSGTGVTDKIDQGIMKEIADPATRDEAQKKMREALTPIHSPEFAKETLDKLQVCFDYLLEDDRASEQIGVIGFCLGGTYAFDLAVNQPSLALAIAFYGHAPLEEQKLAKINCPVLAFYGEKDERLMAQVPELEKTMNRLEKDYDFVVYPNTGHAFFNDTNPVTYNQEAAEDAWAMVLAFLKEHFEV